VFFIVYTVFLFCFFYVYLFLFVLSVLVEGLLPPSENSIAVSKQASNNNNNNNSFIHQVRFALHGLYVLEVALKTLHGYCASGPIAFRLDIYFTGQEDLRQVLSGCDGQKTQSAG
jgi:hypothetical protein